MASSRLKRISGRANLRSHVGSRQPIMGSCRSVTPLKLQSVRRAPGSIGYASSLKFESKTLPAKLHGGVSCAGTADKVAPTVQKLTLPREEIRPAWRAAVLTYRRELRATREDRLA